MTPRRTCCAPSTRGRAAICLRTRRPRSCSQVSTPAPSPCSPARETTTRAAGAGAVRGRPSRAARIARGQCHHRTRGALRLGGHRQVSSLPHLFPAWGGHARWGGGCRYRAPDPPGLTPWPRGHVRCRDHIRQSPRARARPNVAGSSSIETMWAATSARAIMPFIGRPSADS